MHTLPYDLPDFAGRGHDLDRLLYAGPAVVITAIDGMAGIGKTTERTLPGLQAQGPPGTKVSDLRLCCRRLGGC